MANPITSKAAVQLTANSSGFSAGLNPARQAMLKLQSTASTMHSNLRAGFVGMAGYLVVRRVVSELYMLSNKMEDVSNTAKLLNVSAGEFRNLSFAAEQSGLEIDQLQNNMRFLMKNLSGVTEESEKTRRGLAFLQLSPQELRDAGPAGALLLITQRLENIEDPFARAGIALSIFGKSGISMLRLIGNGIDNFSASVEQGNNLSKFLTNDDISRAANYNDAVDRLGFVFENVKIKLLSLISPDMISGVDKLVNALNDVSDAAWKDLGNSIISTTEKVADFLVALEAVAHFSLGGGAKDLFKSSYFGLEKWRASTLLKIDNVLPSFLKSSPESRKELESNLQYYKDAQEKAFESSQDAVDKMREKMRNRFAGPRIANAISEDSLLKTPTQKGVETTSEMVDEWERLNGVLENINKNDPTTKLNQYNSDITKLLQSGLIGKDMATRELKKSNDEYRSALGLPTSKDLDSILGDIYDPYQKTLKKIENLQKYSGLMSPEQMEQATSKYWVDYWNEISNGANNYGEVLGNVANEYKNLQSLFSGGKQVGSLGEARQGSFGGAYYKNNTASNIADLMSGFLDTGLESYTTNMGKQPHLFDKNLISQFQNREPGLAEFYNQREGTKRGIIEKNGEYSGYIWRSNRDIPNSYHSESTDPRIIAFLEKIANNTSNRSLLPQGVAL